MGQRQRQHRGRFAHQTQVDNVNNAGRTRDIFARITDKYIVVKAKGKQRFKSVKCEHSIVSLFLISFCHRTGDRWGTFRFVVKVSQTVPSRGNIIAIYSYREIYELCVQYNDNIKTQNLYKKYTILLDLIRNNKDPKRKQVLFLRIVICRVQTFACPSHF